MFKRIKKIERIGMEEVFDLTIKDNHNLVANNMVIHNCDYRSDVGVILFNLGKEDFVVNKFDRIGQLIISPIITPELIEVDELDETVRGEGGFGHTGK